MVDVDSKIRHAILRSRVLTQIKDCESCSYRATCTAPVPFRGPTPTRFMMIGEAPGKTEDAMGRPFVGRSGEELAGWFAEVGLPPLERWCIANVVSCRPPDNETPRPENVTACFDNLRAQVHLANPDWVLLLGKVALGAVGVRGTMREARGRVIEVPAGIFIGRKVFATFHPAAGLRDPSKVGEIRGDLEALARLIRGDVDEKGFTVRVGRGGKLLAV